MLATMSFTYAENSHAENKSVYGLYEKVQFPEFKNVIIKAKLDTGAKTASLGATDIHFFERNGEQWVSFKPQIKGQDLPVMERLLVRNSNIKRRIADLSEGEDVLHTARPVVLMNICFDGKLKAIEVNLTDRSHFIYPLLLGSSALVELDAIVDPSLTYQSLPNCK
ncbi:ATP-dependent zinc protease family protein [Utexia brackfieldae]|uniref:ATP-dependent zinc protease family protein n=1 Tax=Utexia brackfieldae TaxID=3074108 RepID=UPI00370D39B8